MYLCYFTRTISAIRATTAENESPFYAGRVIFFSAVGLFLSPLFLERRDRTFLWDVYAQSVACAAASTALSRRWVCPGFCVVFVRASVCVRNVTREPGDDVTIMDTLASSSAINHP